MTSRARAGPLAILAALALIGCARPHRLSLQVGEHRVRLVVPGGWEHLDHGRQQLFREGEVRLSLTDFGPVARDADASAPVPSPDSLARRVLASVTDLRRYEIARLAARTIRGSEWIEVETWDRVSHLGRARLACRESGGSLLVLRTDNGPIEQTGPAFEALLNSIEVAPRRRTSR